jgi:hypothetical protein
VSAVGLEQQVVAVQQLIGQLAAVAGDAGLEDEIVVTAGYVQRVELERAEAAHDDQNAFRRSGQYARGREQVANGQEAARYCEADLRGHDAIVARHGVRT